MTFFSLLFAFPVEGQKADSAGLLRQLLDLPAPAPVNAAAAGPEGPPARRESAFYSLRNIPPDDAPIEDLLEYWARALGSYNGIRYDATPSARTVERILDHCDENPAQLLNYLAVLPAGGETAARVKRIYDQYAQTAEAGDARYQVSLIQEWLKYHSTYYLDELVRAAQKIRDRNDYVQNDDQYALRSLARVDWDTARPIVERLEADPNQPYSSILAKWVRYQRAIDAGDSGDVDRYRRELKLVVENRKADWKQRDLALDALVAGGDWEGRDRWYISLLEDETLLTIQDNGYTGLTTLMRASPPENWLETMIRLTGSGNLSVRSAAARNLMEMFSDQKEIAAALLPWLTDPDWARESPKNERTALIKALADLELPESIPALIAVVINDENNRSAAAQTLGKYKDARAVPALRSALSNTDDYGERGILIRALIECGGITDDEQMSALEAYAVTVSTAEGLKQNQMYEYGYDEETQASARPVPLQVSIGKTIADLEEPGEGLVLTVMERIRILRRTGPAVALTLREIMRKWKGRAIYIEHLRQIRDGDVDLETVLSVLARRAELREKIPGETFSLRSAGGAARGLGACLAEEESEFSAILGHTDTEALVAMLGCARMIRARLPAGQVGGLLRHANKLAALAAERYLESEHSVEARTLVLAQHPGEALILGAREAFVPQVKNMYDSEALDLLFHSVTGGPFVAKEYAALKTAEDKLRAEIKENPDLVVIYALLPGQKAGQRVVRVFKDRVTYTVYEDTARYRERTLRPKEYEEFYRFVLASKIDLVSGLDGRCKECPAGEFVMFSREGGRRVFIPAMSSDLPPIDGLFRFFESFGQGELRLHYYLADKIKNLEVLMADEKFTARAVWKNGDDLRVLVEDLAKAEDIKQSIDEQFKAESEVEIDEEMFIQEHARYLSHIARREAAKFDHFLWRQFENGKLSGPTTQPAEAQFLIDEAQAPEMSDFYLMRRAWQVRSGAHEIRAGQTDEGPGLYKVSRTAAPLLVRSGLYFNPVVTADGRWAVVSKIEGRWDEPNGAVRINLQTGREFKISLPPADTFEAVARVPGHNKILLYRAKGKRNDDAMSGAEYMDRPEPSGRRVKNPSPPAPEYYLLDAATGLVQPVKGEFRPLHQQTYRPLQATGQPDEFWAAIYDEKSKETLVGRYNAKTFSFQAAARLPDISLDSMSVWVDEKENKIYFVYEGHLLAAALAGSGK